MASEKILDSKKATVAEISDKLKDSESVILFRYTKSTVGDMQGLRKELKKVDSEVKVYKNTLVKRALDDMNIDLDSYLEGQNAIVFGKELLEPIKIVSKFAKDHDNVEILTGVIDGKAATLETINDYASIPSREGLLTMFAGGLIEHVKNLSIALNLYAEKLGEESK
ncbi:MAG TPA: 50S ribosomal protein L10 [Bacilli bacterium]|jgi:large subunit ribosomal protein L10|nr:50S ribosomal protein L10 [Bacilli bacterium]